MSPTAPGSAASADTLAVISTPTRTAPWLAIGSVASAVVLVDQVTKWWAVNRLESPLELFWTLRLNLAHNTGTAFSLGSGLGPVIGLLAVVIVIVLIRAGKAVTTRTGAVALGLVLGGAVGNLLDRLFNNPDGLLGGAVRDFIDLQWWPIFNIADCGIVIGGALLVLAGLRQGEPGEAAERAESAGSVGRVEHP
ncbi:MAG: signal peptidase II [Acidimicrobiales bacterium]